MHFTYTFPSYLCTSIYMYSICMYTGGGGQRSLNLKHLKQRSRR